MDWRQHYLDTLGNVPDAIEQLFDLDEATATAYTGIRHRVYHPDEDGLPLRYRELLMVVMDIELGNHGGAVNHLKAGISAGLTRTELRDALISLLLVRGVSTWGLVGHQLWRDSAEWFPPAES